MNTWIFQGNPKRFNIDDYLLDNDEIWWSIRQRHYADQIKLNDEVFIWRSDGNVKGSGGIVAKTIVTASPQEYVNDEESASYWYEDIGEASYLAVKLQIIDVEIKHNLKRTELLESEVLKELPILRMKQNTNYLLTEELGKALSKEWKRIIDKHQDKSDVEELIKLFHKEMLNITEQTKKFGYNPTRFKQMVLSEGGYATAKKLLSNKTVSDGFSVLWENNALHLSVEAIVLHSEFKSLFTFEELRVASERLIEFGYAIDIEISEPNLEDTIKLDIAAELVEEGNGIEGNVKFYYGKRYERDSKNRSLAIKKHGLNCFACGFNFEKVYGERGKDFIEIHHIKPLSTLEDAIEVNPETDLVPLCANCHRMVHRKKDDVLSLEELKELIEKSKN